MKTKLVDSFSLISNNINLIKVVMFKNITNKNNLVDMGYCCINNTRSALF